MSSFVDDDQKDEIEKVKHFELLALPAHMSSEDPKKLF
jgi:hypothetical protein